MHSNVRKTTAHLCYLGLLVGCLWGCATPQETANLQQSINILFDRVQKLETRVQGVENQGQKADLVARMEELQIKVGSLNGRIEEQQRQLDRLATAAAATPPPAAPASSAVTISPAPSTTPPSSAEPTAGTGAGAGAAPAGPPPKIVIQEEQDLEKTLYNTTMQLYKEGKYDAARKEAQNFVAKYPKSDLADNALFLVGDAYFAEKRYKEAIESYQQVQDRYPKGNKVASAMSQQAAAFQHLGDATAARIIYERLIESYPGTPQAQIAEKELKKLQ
mgnify:FL=1